MELYNPFRDLSRFEFLLWSISTVVVILSYILSPENNVLTLIASVVGVTALIFVAKGYVIGQALTVVFAVLYGIISITFKYYGEAITYLCMSAPAAIISIISWVRHKYKNTKEVEVATLSVQKIIIIILLTVSVTAVFYFLLGALGTSSLIVSTFSVTTSFLASSLVYLRNPYYAIAYAANDIVLIILWIIATVADISYLPMIFCFVMFLLNDLYGFFYWSRMRVRQQNDL